MDILDDINIINDLDADSMHEHLTRFPEYCLAGWDEAARLQVPSEYHKTNKVIISGMGGSGISGALISDLLLSQNGPLVYVHRGYDLPPWADEDTLVIICSYSGDTEETIEVFQQAVAEKLKILVVTAGGVLGEKCNELGIPVCDVPISAQPRATLGFVVCALARIFVDLEFVSSQIVPINHIVDLLKKTNGNIGLESTVDEKNAAKVLAKNLVGKTPVIYAGGFLSNVALRWATQMNENANRWAFSQAFPELNHNSVVAYQQQQQESSEWCVLLLRSPLLHERILSRYQATCELLVKYAISHEVVDFTASQVSEGVDDLFGQLLSGILFGDWVSYYLAILEGIDPTPVKPIADLKKRLLEL